MSAIITVNDIQNNYLSGVNLTMPNGTPLPSAMFSTALAGAIDWFQNETHIFVTPTAIVNEPHDYNVDEYVNFCYIKLYNYPILSIQNLIASYPTGQTLLLYPASWVRIYANAGEIRITPTSGSLSQVILGQSGSYMPLLNGGMNFFPQLFQVSYTAGFDTDQVPDSVNQIIGMKAAIFVLSAANNFVLQPGISSASIDIDGLNQSLSVVGGKFGPYTPMINIYNDLIDTMLPNIKLKFQGIPFVVL